MAWFDVWDWIHNRLTDAFPEATVTPETDIDPPSLPTILWSAVSSHDEWWEATATITILCTPDDAEKLLEAMQTEVESWQTPGPLHSIELNALMAQRPTTQLAGKAVRQYTFQYTLQWP